MAFFYEKNYNGYDKTYESRILYAGQYYDAESGMYYLRARYYSLDLKRFTQEDTHWNTGNMIYGDNPQKSGENAVPSLSSVYQSGNLYAYCLGNPVLYMDETGEEVSKGKPPTDKDGYIAPKGGARKGKDKHGNEGWIDKNGNIWVPVPDGLPQAHGGGHWDVERPDGKGYVNKYPGGSERKGQGKSPNLPNVSKNSYEMNDVLCGCVVVACLILCVIGIVYSGGLSIIVFI